MDLRHLLSRRLHNLNSPLVLATLAALSLAVLGFVTMPYEIDSLGMAPTGITVKEFYQAKSMADYPDSIRALLNYRYPLSLLLAVATFSTVYFGMTLRPKQQRWKVGGCCFFAGLLALAPTLSFFLLWFLVPMVILGLTFVLVWSWAKENYASLKIYALCLALHLVTLIVVWNYVNDVFAIIA
jgi:hypothetical protein